MTEWSTGGAACAQFAGEFEDEVSSHGIADQRDRLQPVPRDEVVHHGEHVAGEAGVVERRRKGLGAAAVAHVHADDVAARAPQLVGVADDVLRVRRTFETVHDDGGWPRCADLLRLPVALAENLACDLVRRWRARPRPVGLRVAARRRRAGDSCRRWSADGRW